MKETTRGIRAGLLAALVALLMLASALPISADPGDLSSPDNVTWEADSANNITWEADSATNITWEADSADNVTWESSVESSLGITWE